MGEGSIAEVLANEARWCVVEGDALLDLRSMPDRSVDAIVTDPPAGIAFMNAEWDRDRGGRDKWIAWLAAVFVELRRIAKPGAHALVWALPRTSHWTATAIEDAGWTIRDRVSHLFATGFPKSKNLGGGTGSALKPACEDWWLARAPLDGTLIANHGRWGTGGLNVDGCRIGTSKRVPASVSDAGPLGWSTGSADNDGKNPDVGRWPANVVLSHDSRCTRIGTRKVRGDTGSTRGGRSSTEQYRMHHDTGQAIGYADADGTETVDSWSCAPGCPVALLDAQSGDRPGMSGGGQHRADYGGGMFGGIDSTSTARGDSGGASRFFFTAKPASSERDRGLEWMDAETVNDGRASGGRGNDNPRLRGETKRKNVHPTVKPVALMRWLCRLITPPGGVIVDPFAGSGTTLVAALADNFRCIGVEQSGKFAAIARARVEGDMPLLNRAGSPK